MGGMQEHESNYHVPAMVSRSLRNTRSDNAADTYEVSQ